MNDFIYEPPLDNDDTQPFEDCGPVYRPVVLDLDQPIIFTTQTIDSMLDENEMLKADNEHLNEMAAEYFSQLQSAMSTIDDLRQQVTVLMAATNRPAPMCLAAPRLANAVERMDTKPLDSAEQTAMEQRGWFLTWVASDGTMHWHRHHHDGQGC